MALRDWVVLDAYIDANDLCGAPFMATLADYLLHRLWRDNLVTAVRLCPLQ